MGYEINNSSLDWPQFDVQGHRGARGYLPENSIAGFIRALELGATTLEMDAVISRDRQVVVSHDPWFSSNFCASPSGRPIGRSAQYLYRIFEMDYEEVKRFDCGRPNRRIRTQTPVRCYKPVLSEVIEQVESFVQRARRAPVRYSVETKIQPEGDGLLHPPPEEFVELILNVMAEMAVMERCILQSFDPRPLQLVRSRSNRPLLSLLVSRHDYLGVQADVQILGFEPEIYSPDHRVVTRTTIKDAHAMGLKVIPWTVNQVRDMRRLREFGVDGLITDYPDAAVTQT